MECKSIRLCFDFILHFLRVYLLSNVSLFFKYRLKSPSVCLYSMGCVFSAQAAEDPAAPQSTGPAATGF